MTIKQAAVKSNNLLVKAALTKKRWTADERRKWTRASNAVRKLAGLA